VIFVRPARFHKILVAKAGPLTNVCRIGGEIMAESSQWAVKVVSGAPSGKTSLSRRHPYF
jgi:hypothetical protein